MQYLGVKLLRCTLASFLLLGLAHAQNIRVNVPFQFNAGDQLLPAGTYIVKTRFAVSSSGDSFLIAITDLHGKIWKFVHTLPIESSQAQDKGKLVFTCYRGDACLLSQIWAQGDSAGLQVAIGRKALAEVATKGSEQPASEVVREVR
jgi:hypothetical protein